MAAAPFPAPRDDDPEDVHWALTTAVSLQARGDLGEALRWLRKAVAAAVACDCDTRAIELGRCAADLEDCLAVAPTGRGDELDVATDPDGVPSAFARLELGRLTLDSVVEDDLDPPTHVDVRRHHPEPPSSAPDTGSQVAPTPRIAEHGEGEMSSTGAPFTVKAAGVTSSVGGVRRVAPPEPRSDDRPPLPVEAELTMDSDDGVELDDELTLAVRIAPNVHELSPGPDGEGDRHDKTLPAMSSLMRYRVALVASSDGGDARVILLRGEDSAPVDSGVAMLIPASSQDAERIANLLSGRDGRR